MPDPLPDPAGQFTRSEAIALALRAADEIAQYKEDHARAAEHVKACWHKWHRRDPTPEGEKIVINGILKEKGIEDPTPAFVPFMPLFATLIAEELTLTPARDEGPLFADKAGPPVVRRLMGRDLLAAVNRILPDGVKLETGGQLKVVWKSPSQGPQMAIRDELQRPFDTIDEALRFVLRTEAKARGVAVWIGQVADMLGVGEPQK